MANANVAARYKLQASFSYRKDVTGNFKPVAPASFSAAKQYAVTGSGAGVATKGHAVALSVAAGGTQTIDLNSFTDMHGTAATQWTRVKVAILEHADDSVATSTIEITGAAANAVAQLRSSKLSAGQHSVLLADPDGAGLTLDPANGKLVIANNDGSNIATGTLFLEGE
jgi:hypothetical protein